MKTSNNIIELFKDGNTPEEIGGFGRYLYEINSINIGVRSGIYFLFKNGDLQYIGQTVNILSRIGDHIKDKDFDKVYFLPLYADSPLLQYIEKLFIDFYNPPVNRTSIATRQYNSEAIIDALHSANDKIRKQEFDTAGMDAKQRAINERITKSMDRFGKIIEDKSHALFGESDWIGEELYDEIKSKCIDLMERGSIKNIKNGYCDLALAVTLLEYRLFRIKEISSIRELQKKKDELVQEIEGLSKARDAKKMWVLNNIPDKITLRLFYDGWERVFRPSV